MKEIRSRYNSFKKVSRDRKSLFSVFLHVSSLSLIGLSEIVERREPAVVSDSALPAYVRQLSLNLNVSNDLNSPQLK